MSKESKDLELEQLKFAKLYLGPVNWKKWREITQKELELFKKEPLDLTSSYIIYGNKDLLNKFKAFYLTRCLKTRPLYMQCYVTDYANELMINTKDEYGLNVDQDLIFLYIHKHSISTLGKSETWLTETILNKVASRNRDGLITIILSEMKVPSLEDSSELKIINLSEVIIRENMKTILSRDFANGEGSTSSSGAFFGS